METGLQLMDDPSQPPLHALALFVALLCACIVIGHHLEKNRWVNESIMALAIGLSTGILILVTTRGHRSQVVKFKEEIFFTYLLPPIIFNAGFQVKKKQFFRNFMTINLFGVIGTFISFGIISIGSAQLFKILDVGLEMKDYLALGAILSATDSVCTLQVLNQEETPLLYSLVFGEGVVNDATSVVLFNAIERFDVSHISSSILVQFTGNFLYLFILSTLLGISVGLLSAYMMKNLGFGRHSTDREVALMLLMAYFSYITAELCQCSGILTVFFCGIVMSHYTWHNITENSRVTAKRGLETLSFVSEISIFLYVGMDALDTEKWRFVSMSPGISIGVSLILLGLILVGRAASVFPLSFLSNLTKKYDKIEFKRQVTIWWAGLIRGAVSVALAYRQVKGLLPALCLIFLRSLCFFFLYKRKLIDSYNVLVCIYIYTQFTRSGETSMPGNAIVISSIITIVLFSTVVFGLITKTFVRLMVLPRQLPIINMSSDVLSPSSLTQPLLAQEREYEMPRPASIGALLATPTYTIHYHWRRFDRAVMHPIFGGRTDECIVQ
ncbi:hypothetical protein JRO89_XS01G0379200 [Xanthoceras sorbifolium]|uniref:Cation/H+ exchanger transmembrane domain-containing protein n=1 Tax=Xanthoceras sorbifolium TaxID=99658 RepID=A0ABQ8INX5_9ROSI|nr:hypothetical protein JRO89_XS01G0379200 [Xanthoceras sorbifolium]